MRRFPSPWPWVLALGCAAAACKTTPRASDVKDGGGFGATPASASPAEAFTEVSAGDVRLNGIARFGCACVPQDRANDKWELYGFYSGKRYGFKVKVADAAALDACVAAKAGHAADCAPQEEKP